MSNIYSTQKIIYHLEAIQRLKREEQLYPVQIHLMPQNACNHRCNFCSYRLEGNKNTQLFNNRDHIPLNIMKKTLDDFKLMDGKAIEITGGGEPLLYPFREEMFKKIIGYDFDYGLVTNGTLLDEELAKLIAPKMTWARISIDAGEEDTYRKIRKVNGNNLSKAYDAIKFLRKYAKNSQFKLGVGFVINNDNYKEVKVACKRAKDSGADNVRISAIFHPLKIEYFNKKTIEVGSKLAAEAKEELDSDKFTVYNLFDERIHNVELGKQDYKFCGTKEFLCVIGGNCDVYFCCSLAFSKAGLIGNLKDISFKFLWNSKSKKELFKNFDASKVCSYMCLYETRNKFINKLLDKNPMHVNFI